VDARANKMVAEELKQLTIRAIVFHKPDVWESREQFIYDQQGAILKASEEAREEGMREKAIAIARQVRSTE
jgi:peroxiredoxin